jgi:hypothetical protein
MAHCYSRVCDVTPIGAGMRKRGINLNFAKRFKNEYQNSYRLMNQTSITTIRAVIAELHFINPCGM